MKSIEPRQTPCYCMNFRRMANALTKFYDEALAEVGLTANQLSLLTDIHSIQPCSGSELARCARLDRTTVVRNLEGLRKKGLVEKGRAVLCLTKAGTAAMEEGFLCWRQAQDKIRNVFDPETRMALKKAFAQVDQIEAMLRTSCQKGD